jgi:hypothetical protein
MARIVRQVSETSLQAIYNEYFALRVASGELVESLKYTGHPSPVNSGQPHCTESHYMEYREQDGFIPTRNGLDPKWVLHDGVIYKQAPKQR